MLSSSAFSPYAAAIWRRRRLCAAVYFVTCRHDFSSRQSLLLPLLFHAAIAAMADGAICAIARKRLARAEAPLRDAALPLRRCRHADAWLSIFMPFIF